MAIVKLEDIGWYERLIEDLKLIESQSMVFGWLAVGDRIIKDYEKFDKAEYGNKRVENIAKDMGYSSSTLEKSIHFARKTHKKLNIPDSEHITLEKFRTNSTKLGIEGKTWYWIHNNWLSDKEKKPVKQVINNTSEGKYNIIYADPPWKYYEGGYKNQSQHYSTMELEQICQLQINGKHVSEIGAENSLLFLWVTFPMLDNFIDVLRCWGFEYSTVAFIWIKSKNDGTGFAFGLGNWTRSNAEICVLGRRGSVPRVNADISQIIYTPKEEHSKKPDIVRDKIIELVGDLPRIELFARQEVKGWDRWGTPVLNQI